MCIIIVKPADAHVSKAKLKESWFSNRDGGGFAFINSETEALNLYKGFFEFKEFYDRLRQAEALNPDSPFLIHMRIATHGLVDHNNTHPHRVNDSLVMAHNGTFRMVDVPKDSPHSDTVIFIRDILNKLPEGWENSAVVMNLLENYISHNKIVFMDNLGRIIILNKSLGVEEDGCWFSNYSFRPRISTTVGFGYTGTTALVSKTNLLPFHDKPKCSKCKKPIHEDNHFDGESGLCLECLVETQIFLNQINVSCVQLH